MGRRGRPTIAARLGITAGQVRGLRKEFGIPPGEPRWSHGRQRPGEETPRGRDDSATCAGPYCCLPLARAATGRRALYCGPNCRQAARRARARAEEEAAELAARLAEAQATASRLFRPLEEAGFHTVADLAALVFSAAPDPGP